VGTNHEVNSPKTSHNFLDDNVAGKTKPKFQIDPQKVATKLKIYI